MCLYIVGRVQLRYAQRYFEYLNRFRLQTKCLITYRCFVRRKSLKLRVKCSSSWMIFFEVMCLMATDITHGTVIFVSTAVCVQIYRTAKARDAPEIG